VGRFAAAVVVTGLDVEKDAKEAKKVVAKVTVPDRGRGAAGQRDLVKRSTRPPKVAPIR